MELPQGLSRPPPEKISSPRPDICVRVKTLRRVRCGTPQVESSTFGDPRRTVRYLTFIYDKVSLDRP